MAGWGEHWESSALGTGLDAAGELSLAEEVDWVDDFITHDWRTGRWPKYFALCVVYNSEAAAMASFVAMALLMLGGLSSASPISCGSVEEVFRVAGRDFHRAADGVVVWGTAVFWCCFFFWQRLKATVCGCWSRFVFVDKLCISQGDSELKKQGILSLGKFIKRSERMLMLWSTSYFSRLWCTFEIACWLRLGRDFTSVRFMPVDWGLIIVVGAAGLSLNTINRMLGLCAPWLVLVAIFGMSWTIRVPMRALVDLPAQIENFSVRDAECFCCSNHHRNPQTGERIFCDRLVIYSTLAEWFERRPSLDGINWVPQSWEDVESTPAAALDCFDQFVRTLVGGAFLSQSAGFLPFRPRYREALIVSFAPGLEELAQLTRFAEVPLEVKLRGASLVATQYLCTLPCVLRLALVLNAMAAVRGYGERRIAKFVLTAWISFVLYGVNVLIYTASVVTAGLADPLPQGIFTVLLISITIWSYA